MAMVIEEAREIWQIQEDSKGDFQKKIDSDKNVERDPEGQKARNTHGERW
jgi:hypothetical protein